MEIMQSKRKESDIFKKLKENNTNTLFHYENSGSRVQVTWWVLPYGSITTIWIIYHWYPKQYSMFAKSFESFHTKHTDLKCYDLIKQFQR